MHVVDFCRVGLRAFKDLERSNCFDHDLECGAHAFANRLRTRDFRSDDDAHVFEILRMHTRESFQMLCTLTHVRTIAKQKTPFQRNQITRLSASFLLFGLYLRVDLNMCYSNGVDKHDAKVSALNSTEKFMIR